MRIGVVGAGQMAEALALGWARAGHHIMIGARRPDRAEALAARIQAELGGGCGADGVRVGAGSPRQAAAFGDVVLVAVAGDVLDALGLAGADEGVLSNRVLVDCTNAFAPDSLSEPPDLLLAEHGTAERIAEASRGARVVKAFNVCAAEVWRDGPKRFEGRTLGVPICGDDPEALGIVGGLVRDLGFEPVNAGGLARARYLEATAAFVIGLWFAGMDARALFPPLEATGA